MKMKKRGEKVMREGREGERRGWRGGGRGEGGIRREREGKGEWEGREKR